MRHDIWSRSPSTSAASQVPPYRGNVVHHHDHCALRCPYCGPDSSAWAVGELFVAGVVAIGVLTWWLVRRPLAALVVAVVVLSAWVLVA